MGNAARACESVLGHRLYSRYADFPTAQSIGDDVILRHGSFLEHGAATVGHWSPVQRAPGGTLNMEWLLQRRINRRQNKARVAKATAGARSTAASTVEESASSAGIVSSEALLSSAGASPATSLGGGEVHRAGNDIVIATNAGTGSLPIDEENKGTTGESGIGQAESSSVSQAHRDVTFRAAAAATSHQEVTSAAVPPAIQPTAGGKKIKPASRLLSPGTQPAHVASTSSYRIGRSGPPTFRSLAPPANAETAPHLAGDGAVEARSRIEATSSSPGSSPEAAREPEKNSDEMQPALPAQAPGYRRAPAYEARPIFQRTRAQRSTLVTGGAGAADAPAAGLAANETRSAAASVSPAARRDPALPTVGHPAQPQAEAQRVFTQPGLLRQPGSGPNAPAVSPTSAVEKSSGQIVAAQRLSGTEQKKLPSNSPASPVSRVQREEASTHAGHGAGAQGMAATVPPAMHGGSLERNSGKTFGASEERESFAAAPVAAGQSGDPSAPAALSGPSSPADAADLNAPGSSTYRFVQSLHRAHALASGTHSFAESLLSRHRESSIAQRSNAGNTGSGEGFARPIVQPASRLLPSLTPALAKNATTSVPVTPPEKDPPSGAEARVATITSGIMESSSGVKSPSAQANSAGVDRQPLDHAADSGPAFRVHSPLANAPSLEHVKGWSSPIATEPANITTNRAITAEAEHLQATFGPPIAESEGTPHSTAAMLEQRHAPDIGAVPAAVASDRPPASGATRVALVPDLSVRLAPIAQRGAIASGHERLPVVHAASARSQEGMFGGSLSTPAALGGARNLLSRQASGTLHHVLRPGESTAGATRMTHVAATIAPSATIHRSPSPVVPAANPGSLATGAVPPAALPAQPVSLTAQGAKNIDVTQLANRVYDLLVRRLASERQRRGA
jgi:hypothetical protein